MMIKQRPTCSTATTAAAAAAASQEVEELWMRRPPLTPFHSPTSPLNNRAPGTDRWTREHTRTHQRAHVRIADPATHPFPTFPPPLYIPVHCALLFSSFARSYYNGPRACVVVRYRACVRPQRRSGNRVGYGEHTHCYAHATIAGRVGGWFEDGGTWGAH